VLRTDPRGVDLDNLIITFFCAIDDSMKEITSTQKIRQRGPEPVMSDSEVMTIETVGEMLGIDQDKELFYFFQYYYSHFFPSLKRISRVTFVRQAANLWKIKERIWQHLLKLIEHDPSLRIVDSLPVPVCLFARATRCQRFAGKASFGKDRLICQTFYGFRLHVCISQNGLITRFVLAPANEQDIKVVPELVTNWFGFEIGDRNYWSPILREELAKEGVWLIAPYKRKSKDPNPEWSHFINQVRHLIETIFSQLTGRFNVKKVWARDIWHLLSRLYRKVLSHTLAFMLNLKLGNPPLQFENLVT
jgi:hypothetical protein